MTFSTQPAPVPAPEPEVPEPTSSKRRVLVGGGVAVGLAAVAGITFVLLSGGGDTRNEPTANITLRATGQAGAPTANPTAAPTASALPTTVPSQNSDDFTDPFIALVNFDEVPAPTDPAVPADNGTDPVDPGTDPADPGTDPADPGTDPSTGGQADTAQKVSLSSISKATAVFAVNAKKHTVTEGESFAEYFKLLAIEGECGSVQYGDVTFQLCEGDSVSLR
ncbi:MAG: hypothetical protein ACRCTR_05010 [Actinomycetota bacterium]